MIARISLVSVSILFLVSCGQSAGNGQTLASSLAPQPSGPAAGSPLDFGADYEQAVGFYSNGSLKNAGQFVLENSAVLKISRPRNRGFATNDMTEIVGFAATTIKSHFPSGERLQIGDVAAEKGGQLAQHASHQNGLDADIAYYRVNHREQNPNQTIGFDELFVSSGKISPNFDVQRNWEFIKLLYQTGRLHRIFMDPVIKQTICTYAEQRGETAAFTEALRRLNPYPSHQDHMHVRITCPKYSIHCVPQTDPPPGSGCDKAMQFDFMPESAEEGC